MAEQGNDHIYISMMVDSLQRKVFLLERLAELTNEQTRLLLEKELDADAFERTINDKGARISELEQLDAGFESLYKKFEPEIIGHRSEYASDITKMKKSIQRITDLSTQIQTEEKRNSERFRSYLSGQKEQIRNVNLNQRTVQTYARNMTDVHKPGQSYFLDETK